MGIETTPGEWLEDQFTEAGYNQISFAEAVNVAQSTVNGWVAGQRPRRRAIRDIAHVLHLDEHDVLRRFGYRQRPTRVTDARTAGNYFELYRDLVELHERMGQVIAAMEDGAPYTVTQGKPKEEPS